MSIDSQTKPPCKICSQPTTILFTELFDDRYGYPGKFDVFQCIKCDFAETIPELHGQELDELYTKYYPRKNITRASVERAASWQPGRGAKWSRWLQGTNNTCHYYIQPGTRVLDVGCGDGASLLEIQRLGAEAFGTEQDKNVMKIATELHLNIFFGNVTEANYPNEYFDAITLSQVLEHIPKPLEFISFLKTKLKNNGRLIMSFPNINSFYRQQTGKRWINWHIPYHLNFFSEKSLAILAEKTGFRLQKITTITPNIWVQLQIRNSRFIPTEGKPSPVWTGASDQKETTKKNVWQQRLEAIRAMLTSTLQIPLIRQRDRKKQGDSWLVIMEKK